MVASLVEKATSDFLHGPDWPVNMEICFTLNRDMSQANDVVKGIKRRIRSRNPKVQLLTLTLLETVIKDCGDIVPMLVAEKGILLEMVKIIKKKNTASCVMERMLILIDVWQEALGGQSSRYPHYYAAYHELLRSGIVFPDRSEPVFTSLTELLTSHPHLHKPTEATRSPAASEIPLLSLEDLQNARGIMDILGDMLDALDPGNNEDLIEISLKHPLQKLCPALYRLARTPSCQIGKYKGLRHEVIVDLVRQCRIYKRRVAHLLKTTTDEELLDQGLALRNGLQRVLAKHEAICSINSVPVEKRKPFEEVFDVDGLINYRQSEGREHVSVTEEKQLRIQLPMRVPSSNGLLSPLSKADLEMDLLSGDSYSSPGSENPPELVVDALALPDMFPTTTNTDPLGFLDEKSYSSTPQFQPRHQSVHPLDAMYCSDESSPELPTFEQSPFHHNSHPNHACFVSNDTHGFSHEHHFYGGDAQGGRTLPPPPWETPAMDNIHQGRHPQLMRSFTQTPRTRNSQMMTIYSQQMPVQPMHMHASTENHFVSAHGGHQMGGYLHGQRQEAQFLEQTMQGVSIHNKSDFTMPCKAEDKLFGDLVDIAKYKPRRSVLGRNETM